jgi:hypothetical protein
MTELIDFLKGFDIQTILSLVGIVWFFTARIKNEMKLMETKMDKQSERIDRLYQMFVDLLKEERDGRAKTGG